MRNEVLRLGNAYLIDLKFTLNIYFQLEREAKFPFSTLKVILFVRKLLQILVKNCLRPKVRFNYISSQTPKHGSSQLERVEYRMI